MTIRKQDIIEVAARLFREKGYAATTVQDIADELGVTKAALYYYVEGKDELLKEIFDRAMVTAEMRLDEALKQAGSDPREKLRLVLHNHLMAVIQETPLLAVFFNERAHLPKSLSEEINARRRKYEETIAHILEEGVRAGVFRKLEVTPTLYGILGMLNWTYKWYNAGGRLRPEELANLFTDLLFEGLLNRK